MSLSGVSNFNELSPDQLEGEYSSGSSIDYSSAFHTSTCASSTSSPVSVSTNASTPPLITPTDLDPPSGFDFTRDDAFGCATDDYRANTKALLYPEYQFDMETKPQRELANHEEYTVMLPDVDIVSQGPYVLAGPNKLFGVDDSRKTAARRGEDTHTGVCGFKVDDVPYYSSQDHFHSDREGDPTSAWHSYLTVPSHTQVPPPHHHHHLPPSGPLPPPHHHSALQYTIPELDFSSQNQDHDVTEAILEVNGHYGSVIQGDRLRQQPFRFGVQSQAYPFQFSYQPETAMRSSYIPAGQQRTDTSGPRGMKRARCDEEDATSAARRTIRRTKGDVPSAAYDICCFVKEDGMECGERLAHTNVGAHIQAHVWHQLTMGSKTCLWSGWCKSDLSDPRALRRHYHTHHSLRIHCTVRGCKRTFSWERNDHLNKHLREEHKIVG